MKQSPNARKKNSQHPSRGRERSDIGRRLAQCEAALASIEDGLLVLDKDWRCTYLNEATAALLKTATEELIGKVIWEVFPASRYPRLHEEFTRAARQKVSGRFEGFYEALGRWYECACYPTDDGLTVVFHDTTSHKQAEEALRASEQRYRTLFESSRDGVIFTDMDGQVLHTNPYYQEMLGYTPQELRALTYQRLTPPRWHEMEAAIVRDQVLTRGYSDEYEKEYIRKDGTVFPISVRVWLIRDEHGRPQGMWGIVRDITERKRAEEVLRESEERLRLAQQAGRVGVFDWNLQNNTAVWTPELEELFGIPVGGFEGNYEGWARRVYPEDLPRVVSLFQEWMQSSRTQEAWQYRFIRDDGQVRWMEAKGRILRDPNGKALRMIGTNMDITERQQAEEALRQSEERYRRLFDENLTGNFLATPDGTVIECNPAFAEIYGFADREQAAQCDISQFNPADWVDLMARLRAECSVRGHQCVHRRPDGLEIHVVANVIGRFGEAAELTEVQGYLYDDTERRRAEEALRGSAAGLAHAQRIAHLGNWEWDLATDEVRWSDEVYRIFGLPPQEFGASYQAFLERVHPDDRELIFQAVDATLHDGAPYSVDHRIILPDGTIRTVTEQAEVVYDVSGTPIKFLGTVLDITERKQAEEALRETRDYLDSLFSYANAPIIVWDPQFTITRFNRAFERLTGREAKEVLGRDIGILFPPDSREASLAYIRRTTSEGQRWEVLEIPILHKDNSVRTVLWNSANVLGPDDKTLIATIAQGQDITERKQAEEALRESEERYHRLFEDDLTGDFISTPEGEILLCNPPFAKMFGFSSAQEAVGTSMLELYLDAGERKPVMERLRRQGRIDRLEAWRKRRDGQPIYIVENLVGHFNEQGELYEIKGYLFDDTERKRAEEALRKSEEKFAKVFRSSPIGIAVTRLSDGRVVEANEAMLKLLHFERDEVIGHATLDLGIWVDVNDRSQAVQELFTAGSVRDRECRLRTKDGGIVTIRFSAELLEFAGEHCMLSTLVDVTERKRAEEALRESEERLKRAQEIAHLGSWDLNLVNDHLSWSDEVYRIFGVRPQEFRATYEAFLEFVHPDDRAAVDAAYSGSLREGRDTYETEHRIVRRSTGEIRIVHEKCEHVRDASGRIIRSIGMVHDITERKQAEESLRELNTTLETRVIQRTAELQHRTRQLQRLTLELSEAEDRERKHLAEILHDDLQQQLAAAKFHLGLLNSRAKRDPTQQAVIAQVDHLLGDAVQKSRSLSHELSPAVLYHSGLAAALGWLADQIRTKHGLNVTVKAFGEVSTESEALKTFLYKAAQELLFNVVKHARVGEARMRLRRLGRCVCLSVSDRGRGFDPQQLRETPGFGLLSIRERVELLGGRMKIRSTPGRGSTFFIVVPDGLGPEDRRQRTEDGVVLRPPSSVLSPPSSEPRLRVLLADDHEIVREGLASLLSEERDIQVVGEAANGREVIDLADQLHPDVVVMDVAMPLISGDEATRQIKLHLPQTRVVALSMYDEAHMVERMYRAGAESYVLKTAPSQELLAAIRGQPVPA